MLQVDNHTPFTAALSVFPDAAGVETAYAVVKATFTFGADGPELAKTQLPLLTGDVFWAAPESSSLRASGEIGLLKPVTDVLLVGRAIAPAADTRVADASLQVGAVRHRVRVFGDRQWRRSAGRWRMSDAQPWQRMPLRWELAFGGSAPAADGQATEHDLRNPVGRGLVAAQAQPIEGQPLPNLEDPAQPIQEPGDRPTPTCFAPVAPTWLPRRAYAGTYDEAWTRRRAPYLPADFDPRFFNVAPPALIAPGFLRGAEPVRLAGFTAGGALEFTLPEAQLDLAFDIEGSLIPSAARLELVLFEPDAGRFQMLWRAAHPVDKKLLRLRRAVVRSAAYGPDGQPPRTRMRPVGLPSPSTAPT